MMWFHSSISEIHSAGISQGYLCPQRNNGLSTARVVVGDTCWWWMIMKDGMAITLPRELQFLSFFTEFEV